MTIRQCPFIFLLFLACFIILKILIMVESNEEKKKLQKQNSYTYWVKGSEQDKKEQKMPTKIED